jgi:hypothetical protein
MAADTASECFVICPIGAEKSEVRARSDKILKHVIRPVAEECGYKAIRADEISEPGSITTQIINHILNAEMLVADLTGQNANVFYELAVRHAIRKPYVQIIEKGERIPFDIAAIRTIEINHTDLDSVAAAKEEIKKQMRFTASNAAKVESPITVAVDLASLTKSDNPLEQRMAELLNGMAELRKLVEDRLTPALPVFYDLWTESDYKQLWNESTHNKVSDRWLRTALVGEYLRKWSQLRGNLPKTAPPPEPPVEDEESEKGPNA